MMAGMLVLAALVVAALTAESGDTCPELPIDLEML